MTIYDGSLQTYGAPRIELDLRDGHGVRVGRKRVARLMKQLGIEGDGPAAEAATLQLIDKTAADVDRALARVADSRSP